MHCSLEMLFPPTLLAAGRLRSWRGQTRDRQSQTTAAKGRASSPPAALPDPASHSYCLPRRKQQPWYVRGLRKGWRNVSKHTTESGSLG